jgi:Na+/melibiose symporter-like transporter
MSDARLSRASIWMYGSLGLPVALLGYPLGIWLPRAYNSYIGVPTEIVGAIISLAAIFDAVTDPIVGFGSDRFRTRYGRRRFWLTLGAPFLFAALWYILNPATGSTGLYLGFWFLFLRLGTTLVLVPYSAWGAELADDYHTRTQIVSAREVCVLLGLIGAAAIPFLVERIHGDQTTAVMVLNAYTLPVLLLLPLTVLLVVTRVPEPPPSVREGKTPFLQSLKLITQNKLFLRLMIITVLVEGGEAFRNALSLYFMQDYIGAPRAGSLYLVYFSMGLLAIPVWSWLARRFGKHRSLSGAIILVGIVSVWIFTLDYGDIWMFYGLFAVKGFCFGAFTYLPRAMMADAIDVDTLRSGDARSGAYFSLHGFIQKCAHSFGGLSLVMLAVVGYDTRPGAAHSPTELRWLGVLYAIVPTVTFGAALAYCWTWPMTSLLHAKLQRILKKRSERLRKQAAPPRVAPVLE